MPDPIQPSLLPGEELKQRLKEVIGEAHAGQADTTIWP